MKEFAIEAVVTDESWSRFGSEPLPAGRGLGFWDIWHYGPEARVLFTGQRTIEYQGSLLYVAEGLHSFTQRPQGHFRWEGEPVWQSPDIEIDVVGDEILLTVAYRRPEQLLIPRSEFAAATAAFLDDVSTNVRAHLLAPLVVVGMPWLKLTSGST